MLEIKVPYNLVFAPLVASFMEESATCFGADENERKHFRLAGEEAFAFIMAGIPPCGLSEPFQLRCTSDETGMVFQFSNHGRPMNVRHIPAFSVDDPENTSDGLSLQLLKQLCSKLLFRNLGQNGWELLLQFPIRKFVAVSELSVFSSGTPDAKATNPEISIKKAGVADVDGIINLVYNTYRYSYVKTLFYDPKALAEAIENGKVISLIALSNSKTVIGHNAVLVESQRLGEVGMSMVDPAFRKTGAFVALLSATLQELYKTCPHMLLYARAVTSHTHSQAFLSGFAVCLIQLSVYRHAAFVGMKGNHNERESLIYALAAIDGKHDAGKIYVPEKHLSFVKSIFDNEILGADVLSFCGNYKLQITTALVEISAEKQHATIQLLEAGKDFDHFLRQQCSLLQQEGVLTIDCCLASSEMQPADIDSILYKNGFIFCGLKPDANEGWQIVYTSLTHQKFDFDNIRLFNPTTAEFRDYIKKNYFELF